MFKPRTPSEPTALEETIEDLLKHMRAVEEDSEQYSKMADQLVKIYALKQQDTAPTVSPDVLATVLGNLLGIILIVGHERAHIVTSKALLFVQKLVR